MFIVSDLCFFRVFKLLPLPIKSALEMMDFSLAKEPVMIILLLSNLFGMLAFYIPFMFITHLAVMRAISLDYAELLLPLIGLSNTLGIEFAVILKCWL